MVLKITVHDVDEGELTDIQTYELSQLVHQFIQEDTEAHTSGVEAIFVESDPDDPDDNLTDSEDDLSVEMVADRIPDEWKVRDGECRGEQIVFSYHGSGDERDPTTAVSVLVAGDHVDAEWLVEVQDVDGTRNMGTLLPVAELSEFDDLIVAYERAIECAHEYGPEAQQEQLIFEVFGVDPDEIKHAWNVGEGDPEPGYDHEAHEAATLVMYALQERFDWAEEIDGVAMGAH